MFNKNPKNNRKASTMVRYIHIHGTTGRDDKPKRSEKRSY